MSANFYNWLQQRIAEYEVARQRGVKAYDTRLQRAAANRNKGAEPIFSEKSGRLHAPFDGYVWVWQEGDSEFEATYLAGQYLPFPKERESVALGAFREETKFVVPADRADKFMSQWQDLPAVTREIVSVYASRVFENKKGVEMRYVTVSHCPKDICEAIREKLVGDLVRLQKYQQEQCDAARAERDAAHESGADVEEGRVVITGEVLAFKWQYSEYGDTLKMLVQDDRGFRVWGSVPKSLDDAERNSRVSFTATVQKSDRDSKFGFFKRPSKAAILEVAA